MTSWCSRGLRAVAVLSVAAFAAGGCTEVRGRRKMQEGNKLFRDGQYKEAVAAFVEAEALVPHNWILWLNKGYTCRQMLIPGAKTPENEAAAKCAIEAFKKLQELRPSDPRGEQYYIQTLFDADEFETLAKMFEERHGKAPNDVDHINGLIQVYSKWNKVETALDWLAKKAALKADDAEAQYSVGVFIWQQLFQKGGGPEKASYDPRPDPKKPKPILPPSAQGDIESQFRVDMADKGIGYLEKAVSLRPKYTEAMAYINLLYRQRSYAYFSEPAEWQKCVDKAEEWRKRTMEILGGKVPAPPALAPKEEEAGLEDSGGGDAAAAGAAATPGGTTKASAGKKTSSKKKARARKGRRR